MNVYQLISVYDDNGDDPDRLKKMIKVTFVRNLSNLLALLRFLYLNYFEVVGNLFLKTPRNKFANRFDFHGLSDVEEDAMEAVEKYGYILDFFL